MPAPAQAPAPPTALASACAEMERRLSAGEDYRSERVFESDPDLAIDADSALEVIYTEFVTREALGHRPVAADFLARFPQFRAGLEQLFDVHQAVRDTNRPDGSVESASPVATGPVAGRHIGNYELFGEIGRGGMGIVYKARQVGLNRFVALKMILSGVDASPRERARFRAEAEAAARLQHPGIVQVHEVGEHDGHPFLVFEYLVGGSLERRLGGKPWPATSAARLIESLAGAVQHAHDLGVVHRDLKPANILLQNPPPDSASPPSGLDRPGTETSGLGTPKVSDFGLARRVATDDATPRPGLTVTGTIVGTPAYMAPEQAVTGAAIGPAADVYSLGAILFELLTGRPPFQGVDILDTLDQVRSRDPVPPSRLVPSMPRDIETICLKCLRKDPRQRYASAADVGADLGRFLRGEPVRARPTSTWERAWKWARRRPGIAGLLAALALLVVVGIGTVTVLWRQTAAALVAVRKERNEKEEALAGKTVALAHREWVASDIAAAQAQLAECPPAFRGPQWHYLDRACRAKLFDLKSGVRGEVLDMDWSPDGQFLAATHNESVVRVWELSSHRETCALLCARPKRMRFAGFTADSQLFTVALTGSTVGPVSPKPELEVARWDPANGRALGSFTAPWPTQNVIPGNGGRHVVEHFRRRLHVVDVVRGPESATSVPLPIDYGAVRAQRAVSREGQFFAGFVGLQVVVWDTARGAAAGPAIRLAQGIPHQMAFSPDSRLLAIGAYKLGQFESSITIRDVASGHEVAAMTGHSQLIECLAFSPDGGRLATGSTDKTAVVWDVRTGREIITLRGSNAPVSAVAFTPDGDRLATACRDGSIHVWDVRPIDEP